MNKNTLEAAAERSPRSHFTVTLCVPRKIPSGRGRSKEPVTSSVASEGSSIDSLCTATPSRMMSIETSEPGDTAEPNIFQARGAECALRTTPGMGEVTETLQGDGAGEAWYRLLLGDVSS